MWPPVPPTPIYENKELSDFDIAMGMMEEMVEEVEEEEEGVYNILYC